MLLISISGTGYAAWSDRLTTTATLNSGTEDIEVQKCIITYYNGFGCKLDFDPDTVSFEDTALFPGWELELILVIHNVGDVPVYISHQISYSLGWDETTWVPTDETTLYTKFRIDYNNGFYGAGPDEELFTDDDEAVSRLWPCETGYKREHLFFDAQKRPDLQDEIFSIKVEIIATTTG